MTWYWMKSLALIGIISVFGLWGCSDGEKIDFDSCDDGETSGAETDVDCGGPTCEACGLGLSCKEARDCASGICEAGICVESACATGLTRCDGVCVNTQSDPKHCGECGKACETGQVCALGECVTDCPEGLTECASGSCVDLESDEVHCGTCGHACDTGQTCEEGECAGGGEELSIVFVAPTEADGAVVDRDWTEVAVAVTAEGQASAFIDWDHSLAGYWSLNETEGATAADKSSHDNFGLLENGPVWTPGKFGGALLFDGVDDRVVVEPNEALGETGPITIEAWIKPAVSQELCEGDSSNNGIVAKCDQAALSTNKCSWQLRYGSPDNCRLGFMFKESSSEYRWASVGADLVPGQWHHVLGTYDGETLKCYLNGIESATTSMTGYLASDSRLLLGEGGFGTYFEGEIDEVRVHNRALSPEEIAASHEMCTTLMRRFEGIESGAHEYQAFVTDEQGAYASTEPRELTVDVFAIITESLPAGVVDVPYEASLEVSGGQAPYAWSIESGALPVGLTLSVDGQVHGIPVEDGNDVVTVGASDATALFVEKEFEIHIAQAAGQDPVYTPSYYVDASNGDDSSSGRSENEAWRTLGKVSSKSFVPGDVIAFKRGQAWEGSLSVSASGISGNPIVVTSYGDGARPIIDSNGNIPTSWSLDSTHGPNIYSTACSTETNRLWLNNVEQYRSTGRNGLSQQWTELGDVLTSGEIIRWTWDSGKLWWYSSTGAPIGQFSGIRFPSTLNLSSRSSIKVSGVDIKGGNKCVNARQTSNVTFEYCSIGYNSSSAIAVDGASHLLIERNSLDSNFHLDYGGIESYSGNDGRGCYDAIESYGSTNNFIVRYNDFFDWGHSAISIQGGGSTCENNEAYYNHFSFENGAYGRALDINGNGTRYNTIRHNHVYAQKSPSHAMGQDNYYHHNYFVESVATVYKGGEYGYCIDLSTQLVGASAIVNNNVFEHNTCENATGPMFGLLPTNEAGKSLAGNVFHKNLSVNCGTNPHYAGHEGYMFRIEQYSNLGPNTYTDNAVQYPTSGDVVNHRYVICTMAEFNARNGTGGDVISGNTHTVTDQGAGDVYYENTGLRH